MKETIRIKEDEFNLGKVLKQGSSASIDQKIGALTLIENQIARLKVCQDSLKAEISSSTYEGAVAELTAAGKVSAESAQPVVEIIRKSGEVISVLLMDGSDNGFEISKEIKEKAVLDGLVPDKYKKVSITLDSKAIENDFESGALPDILKPYVSQHPKKVLKLRKTMKGGK